LLDDPSNDQLLWRPLPCYLLACISLEHVYQIKPNDTSPFDAVQYL